MHDGLHFVKIFAQFLQFIFSYLSPNDHDQSIALQPETFFALSNRRHA